MKLSDIINKTDFYTFNTINFRFIGKNFPDSGVFIECKIICRDYKSSIDYNIVKDIEVTKVSVTFLYTSCILYVNVDISLFDTITSAIRRDPINVKSIVRKKPYMHSIITNGYKATDNNFFVVIQEAYSDFDEDLVVYNRYKCNAYVADDVCLPSDMHYAKETSTFVHHVGLNKLKNILNEHHSHVEKVTIEFFDGKPYMKIEMPTWYKKHFDKFLKEEEE